MVGLLLIFCFFLVLHHFLNCSMASNARTFVQLAIVDREWQQRQFARTLTNNVFGNVYGLVQSRRHELTKFCLSTSLNAIRSSLLKIKDFNQKRTSNCTWLEIFWLTKHFEFSFRFKSRNTPKWSSTSTKYKLYSSFTYFVHLVFSLSPVLILITLNCW